MVRRPGAQELIVGAAEDPQFGPVILVGQGGTAVEAISDRAIGLPPLNLRLAQELVSRTRIYRVLQGVRGQPPADLDALALTLVRVAQLVIDVPQIRELDINPLLIDTLGVIALDARIASGRVLRTRNPPPCDPPLPSELEEEVLLPDGRRLLLRPIRPEDEPSLRRAFDKLTPEEVRLRFFAPMSTLDHAAAARLTQIDYEREMALVLTDPGCAGLTEIYGVVRLIADADNERMPSSPSSSANP
jgi:acetyltransferase